MMNDHTARYKLHENGTTAFVTERDPITRGEMQILDCSRHWEWQPVGDMLTRANAFDTLAEAVKWLHEAYNYADPAYMVDSPIEAMEASMDHQRAIDAKWGEVAALLESTLFGLDLPPQYKTITCCMEAIGKPKGDCSTCGARPC